MNQTHKKKISNANKISLKKYFQTEKGKEQAKAHSKKLSGRKLSEAHKHKIRLSAPKGERNKAWKGESVSYRAIHLWVQNILGKACKCSNRSCFYPRKNRRGSIMLKPIKYDWANISGEYKRDLSDWIQLCRSCHMLMDLGGYKPVVD